MGFVDFGIAIAKLDCWLARHEVSSDEFSSIQYGYFLKEGSVVCALAVDLLLGRTASSRRRQIQGE